MSASESSTVTSSRLPGTSRSPPAPQTGFSSSPELRDLYPPIEPYAVHHIKVSEIHTLYVEECGNPNGLPVVFVHGGPGGGCGPDDRRFFHPTAYRSILIDQRGSGRSTPPAELRENDTWRLVEDMERVRVALGVGSWHVFGGSWGSTLALAYAITHPTRVLSLTLRGIFLLRPSEITWFYEPGGAQHIYPDAFEPYLEFIPENERDNVVGAYYKRLTGVIEEEKKEAAKRWAGWECGTSRLVVDAGLVAKAENPAWAMAFSTSATVAQTLTGFVFYGPFFAEKWLKAMRKDKNDPKYLTGHPEPRDYTVKMISSVALDGLKAFTLLHLYRLLRPQFPYPTISVPTFLLIGLVVPAVAGEVNWEDRPSVLPGLRAANAVFGGVVGVVVGAWVGGV
ncbi:hypothetical protein HDU93_003478 [Gonapodya sp. JEL0774]|nr:hypothetical protein HDU93_003478 [Gonapodya sp. JEL0774]